MIVEQMGNQRANSKTIERWSVHLQELHSRIANRFLRSEVRERAYRYLSGLLEDVRRKNSWQMAEAIGETKPRGVRMALFWPTQSGSALKCYCRIRSRV